MDTPPPNTSSVADAPDKEKMDQIRRRRMEKLGAPKSLQDGGGRSPSTAASTSASAEKTENLKPKFDALRTAASPDAENPFAKLTSQTSSSTIRSVPKKPHKEESIEAYENRILGSTFRITIDPKNKVDSGNHKLIYLSKLRRELEDEGAPLLLSRERLDSAILEAASTVPPNKSVLDYLLPCFKRVVKALTGLRDRTNAKIAVLNEAERLCLSYCIFAVEVPDLFSRSPNPSLDTFTPYLLLDPSEEKSINSEFMIRLMTRYDEEESVRLLLTNAAVSLSECLSTLTMNDNYKPYVNALKLLCQDVRVITAVAQHPLFQTVTSAPEIEKNTILGPFFRISPLQPEVTLEYFSAARTMDHRMIATAQEALQLTLRTHQKDLLEIVNNFIRASELSRNKTLDWFAHIVNSNHKRRALRSDPASLSSDGFLINVTAVLDGLCAPFMDTTFLKIGKIDINYLRRNPRVDIKDETKLNADQDASDQFYDITVDGTSNFISEVFFLTLAAHHYGSQATSTMLTGLDKDIKALEEKLAYIELQRPNFANSPSNLARFEEEIRRFENVLSKSVALKYACQGVLHDKTMQARSLLFMRYVTVWLLRIATETDYSPEKTIRLPLPADIPEAFRYLPEYIIEDIAGNFNFIFRSVPDVMISAVGDELIVLCITFLTNSEYIKNPYLKAKLVSVLFHGTWPLYHRSKGLLGDALTGNKFANDYLLHSLIKFYIEVESTGAHTQFYDKFNIRYEIFQVIKCIWTNDIYQQHLIQESKTNTEFFLRFVNLLLNDATYVLDEALSKLPKIHDFQHQLRTDTSLTAERRTAVEEELRTAESQAQSYMQLTNETVAMMKLFTKTLSSSFTMPEIVDRVAAMLDYTLDLLVGPKSINLKVDDMKKFQFEPRTLLSEFVDIFLNLSVSENFVKAVAQDGRSYKPASFDAASRILSRYSLKSAEQINAWDRLKTRFARAKEEDDQDEEDFGEIPDEFLDPLLAILMNDPVILPVSKQVLDRSTIRTHLLSDPHDPFNRSPLKIEDVIEDTELKAKITLWKLETKAKAEAARKEARNTLDIN